jgi:PDZ domain
VATESIRGERQVAAPGLDWAVALLSLWFIGGVYLDGWAHLHLQRLESFFTPWHAVLYSGYLAVALVLVVTAIRYRAAGHSGRWSMPPGYELSLLGVAIFALGGVGDMMWHTLFGIEVDLDALLSPTHLLLALGGSLMVTGPLRAAWHRLEEGSPSLVSSLPMLLSLTLLLSLFTFLTQYVHPFGATVAAESYRPATLYRTGIQVDESAGQVRVTSLVPGGSAALAGLRPGDRIVQIDGRPTKGLSVRQVAALIRGKKQTPVMLTILRGSEQLAAVVARDLPEVEEIGFWRQADGIAGILLQTGLLMGVILATIRRWRLPPGSLTLIIGVNALWMTLMRDRMLSTGPYPLIAVAVLGGLVGDLLARRLQPSADRPRSLRVFAFALPAVLYLFYFIALMVAGGGIWWTIHFWTGAVVLAGAVGVLMSLLVTGPLVSPARVLPRA